jgi:hypothetical protein
MNRSPEGKSKSLIEDLKGIREEYRNAIEIYRKYKEYKRKLGKPERYPLDPKKIMEDLSSAEFFELIEKIGS